LKPTVAIGVQAFSVLPGHGSGGGTVSFPGLMGRLENENYFYSMGAARGPKRWGHLQSRDISFLTWSFDMRYLVWALRLVVFVVVLLFALKNTDRVNVYFFADHLISEVPLIVVMLASFVVGAIFGLLLTVPGVMRRRREMAALRRELEQVKAAGQGPAAADAPPSPDVVLPVTPL